MAEQRREIREIIKSNKDKEDAEKLPKSARSKYAVKTDKVYINGQLQRKKITPPTVQQLFPDSKEQQEIDKISFKLFHTDPEQGSSFKVAVFRPKCFEDVRRAYIKLSQDYPAADHISMACSVAGESAYHDNGEHGSGFRILRVIKQYPLDNVALFMMRHYGGVNLGPRRFKIMAELSKAALEKAATLHDPNTNIVPKSRSPIPSPTSSPIDPNKLVPQQPPEETQED